MIINRSSGHSTLECFILWLSKFSGTYHRAPHTLTENEGDWVILGRLHATVEHRAFGESFDIIFEILS